MRTRLTLSGIRWIILLASIVAAAVYLNSAAFSAWVAGGPPNPYPEAWGQRALVHLCMAGTILLAGIAVFRVVGSFPSLGRTTILLFILALLIFGVPYVREFLQSDACLDSGGRWNSGTYQCETRPNGRRQTDN